MSSVPPPRPPPAVFGNPYEASGQLMGAVTQFNGGLQPPFLGGGYQSAGYGIYDPYNRIGMLNNNGLTGNYGSTENSFVRLAEESSRNAFQSIESVVSAVASVSNMLSSMHNAVFNSFRAVIGVADQFNLLKQQSSYIFLNFLHILKLVWRRILTLLHLRPKNYATSENVWASVVGEQFFDKKMSFNWAALFFWVVALGGPYLLYKCVSQMVQKAETSLKWATGNDEHYTAKALFDFNALNNQELSFCANDMLRIAPKIQQPKVRDWLLASTVDGKRIGLVPINYIKLINRNLTKSPTLETRTFNSKLADTIPSNSNIKSSESFNSIYSSLFQNLNEQSNSLH